MAVVLTIDGIDHTAHVLRDTLRKEDNLYEKTDTLSFSLSRPLGFVPALNSTVELSIDDTLVFGGVITRIEDYVTGGLIVHYDVTCADYSRLLTSKLANQRYTSQLAGSVIKDLIDTYAPGFTYTNVADGITLPTIAFDRVPVTEAIQKIAELTNYAWYVDENKDVHFFSPASEAAPFSLSDTNGNYIWRSLRLYSDTSQVRNRVIVRGGLEVSETERTEQFTAPSSADERTVVRLAYKYDSISAVTVNGVALTVGVEFLNSDADYEAMWSYQEKYIRFTAGHEPSAGDIIEVTGFPLFPIIVQVSDNDSIAAFATADFDGIFEFLIKDDAIKSRDEAIARARAELGAYAQAIVEAEFETYEPDLRSGQTITIQSDLRGIDDEYVIQSVSAQPRNDGAVVYSVKLATLKTIGIIEVLQRLLRNRSQTELEGAVLLTLQEYSDGASAADTFDSSADITTNSPPYTYAGGANDAEWGFASWV
jgi:hypothetical protein